MTFSQSVKSGLSKYVQFSGRASRSEYWWWTLFMVVFQIAMQLVIVAFAAAGGEVMGMVLGALFLLVILGLTLPSISVLVRRLHDVNRSGWWYWIVLVPVVGVILMLVWFCTKGTEGPNRFGEDPLGGTSDDEGFAQSSIPSVG